MSLSTSIRCLIQRNIFTATRFAIPTWPANKAFKPPEHCKEFTAKPAAEPPTPAAEPPKAEAACPEQPKPPKMPSALIVFANGSEDMETVITADVLRRAGIEVTLADISGLGVVTMSNQTKIVPDASLCASKDKPYDAIILPGGLGGTKAMIDSSELGELLREQEKSGKYIAAICAAPTALQAHRIGFGKKITSYPTLKDALKSEYCYSEDKVVIDGKLITSRGPGTACQFSLQLINKLIGKEKAEEIAKQILTTMDCVPDA